MGLIVQTPVTDYERVMEKAASEKRDLERALTRFITKTARSTICLKLMTPTCSP